MRFVRRPFRSLVLTLLVTITFALSSSHDALADIGPKPTQYGSGPRPMGKDMEGIEISMAAEDVSLTLRGKDKWSATLEVVATFSMHNPGEATRLETGFPFGAFENVTAFSVEVDGKNIPAKLVNKGESVAKKIVDRLKPRRPRPGMNRNDFWYVWTAPYAGKNTSTHIVRYTVALTRMGHQRTGFTGYILHSGSPWKGLIGKGKLTLRCADGITFDHLRSIRFKVSGKRFDDRLEWTFTDLEPTKEHDIRLSWGDTTWIDDLAEAESDAKTRWQGRYYVALHWERTPSQYLRSTWTEAEADKFADALLALVDERKTVDDRLVLPAKEPRIPPKGLDRMPEHARQVVLERVKSQGPATRSYVRNPRSLLRFIEPAVALVRGHPKHEGAKNALKALVEIYDALERGALYADATKIELRDSDYTRKRMIPVKAAYKQAAVILGQSVASGS